MPLARSKFIRKQTIMAKRETRERMVEMILSGKRADVRSPSCMLGHANAWIAFHESFQ
jgi:hypothetical protein